MEQSESQGCGQIVLARWLVGADGDRFGRKFRCTSTGEATLHLSFAGVQLETTAEYPVTDGVHPVRNPDIRFGLVAVTIYLRVISIHMAFNCHSKFLIGHKM